MQIKDTAYEVEKIEEDFYQILRDGKSIAKGRKDGLGRLLKLLIQSDEEKGGGE